MEKTDRCIECMRIRPLSKEELKFDPNAYGLCSGEGGTKDKNDILAYRDCSRFLKGENKLKRIRGDPGDHTAVCMNCNNLIKVPYILARPTHHENWECPKTGTTKQLEDCQAQRNCKKFDKGQFKNTAYKNK